MRVLFLLFLSAPAHAGLFTAHVKEAIVINQERKSHYSEITRGKSDPALRRLIMIEKLMLPSAMFYDQRAEWYQDREVPLLKDEFMSMRPREFERGPTLPEVVEIPWKNYRKELRFLIKKRDQKNLLARSLEIVQELKAQPSYWCLTRHLVESIHRFAYFLPERINEARRRNIKSPETLIWKMIRFHTAGFREFAKIDRLAAPVQEEGVPLLCAELPDLLEDLSSR